MTELKLLNRQQVADVFGVTPWTIDQWRRTGRFVQPVTTPGRTIRWRQSDIESYLDEMIAPDPMTPDNRRTNGGSRGKSASDHVRSTA